MKPLRIVLALVLVVSGAFAAESAMAGGRSRVSVGIGFGFGGWGYPAYGWGGYPYYGYGYGYPYYAPYYAAPYYAAPVVVQQQPTVYIEQPQAPQAQTEQPAGYWYFCNDSRAYYPYVKDCASAWQRVAPQPQN